MTAESPVLELPVFRFEETAELPPREAWRYGKLLGFEILSNASDEETQEWVHDLQTALQVGELVWPIKLSTNRPNALILCKNARACDDFGFHDYYRKMGLTRIFFEQVSDWEQQFIVRDASYEPAQVDRWKRFSGIYGRRYQQSEPGPPEWMSGVTQHFIFWAVSVENDKVAVGRMLETYSGSLLRRSGRDVPLSKAFKASSSQGDKVVVGQYWKPGMPLPELQRPLVPLTQFMAFMQMCLLEKPERYERAFVRFINRARLEPVTPELFEECFGRSVLALEKEVTEYEETMRFMKQARVKTVKGTLKYESLVLRDATDAEVGRIKGEALALMAAPKQSPRAMLRAPYVRGERDPRLLAAIGLHERKLGNDPEARRFLEAAVREKVDRPRAYVELARMCYQESMKTPQGSGGKLDATQLQPVMALLEAARALSPKIPEVYDLIAEVAAHSDGPAMRSSLVAIDEGLRLFPYHAELYCQGAAAFMQAGRFKDAAKLIDHGLLRFRYYERAYRERLQQLQATLPAVTSPPAQEPVPQRS